MAPATRILDLPQAMKTTVALPSALQSLVRSLIISSAGAVLSASASADVIFCKQSASRYSRYETDKVCGEVVAPGWECFNQQVAGLQLNIMPDELVVTVSEFGTGLVIDVLSDPSGDLDFEQFNGLAISVECFDVPTGTLAWSFDSPSGVHGNWTFVQDAAVGFNYCLAELNSTGAAGWMSASGSLNVGDNDVTLTAKDLPHNTFGFFIVSANRGFAAMPGGSSGNLCLSGTIGRYASPGQIQNTMSAGSFSLAADLMAIPSPIGSIVTSPGDTWNFQAWFRDFSPAGPTSNFTDGLELTFH